MATISSPGIGSGLQIKEIVKQLVDIEKQPLTTLQLQKAATETRISAYGQIKSLFSALSDAAGKLTSLTTWNATTAQSSNADAVKVSAAGGTAGNDFLVKVTRLAQAQSYASATVPKDALVGAGTLTLELGKYNDPVGDPSDFTPAAGGSPLAITVSASDTLADVASKINDAGSDLRATILNDGTGQRLLIRSAKTGEETGFRLSVTDDDGNNADNNGLSRLVAGGQVTQYGQDASVLVNNSITVSSATNTFSDIVSGVTLTVSKTTDTDVAITVGQDRGAITTAIDEFVKAYNAINQTLNEATKYDAGTKSAGLLQGDSAAVGLQNALRRVLQSATEGAGFSRLADLGISQQLGGDLTVDSSKLSEALDSNFEGVKALFRNDSPNAAADGVMVKLKDFATGVLGVDGVFNTKDKSLKRSLELNSKETERINAKAARIEAQLLRRYSALDAQLSSLTALNNYVAQQVTQWNNAKNN